MMWSRNGSKVPDELLVLGFPNGVQALLDPRQLAEEDEEDEEGEEDPRPPVRTSRGQQEARPPALPPANARALIAWHMAGLSLFFGGRQPSLREVLHEAKGVALAFAMERNSENITHVALALGASRRAVRTHLQSVGLYDWTRIEDGGEPEEGGGELGTELVEEVRIDGGQ